MVELKVRKSGNSRGVVLPWQSDEEGAGLD